LFFGGLALLLTCMGFYGLEVQRVTQRTAEIGLRVALGAQRRAVLWFILREAVLFFTMGIPAGLALAAVVARFIQSLLYETSALDSRIHGVALGSMLAVGFVAAYLPARRALRIDPMVALRYE
jgi:ABC-type antimicrobial peptide transport system permease subunit